MFNSIRPEEKLAQRFVRKYGLVPPIDVFTLIRRFADIEEDSLPENVDAVCIMEGKRPLIIYESNAAYVRKRFTLAHELGHLIIPWHIGTLTCHTESYDKYDDYIYGKTEAEANRFASGLLTPSSFIERVVKDEKDIEKCIRLISDSAEVSLISACLSVYNFLDPGYVVMVVNGDNILLSLKSPGTLVLIPDKSDRFDKSIYTGLCLDNGVIRSAFYSVYWWKFGFEPINKLKRKTTSDMRNSKEVLDIIMNTVFRDKESKRVAMQSLNGIIGAVNSQFRPDTLEHFYGMLKQRLVARSHLEDVINHPEFEVFMIKRLKEIIAKRP